MKKSIIALLHFGFWSGFIFLLLLMIGIYFHGEVDETQLPYYFQIMLGFAIIPAAISFYSFHFILFPKYLQHNKVMPSVLLGVLISVIAVFFGDLTIYLLIGRYEDYTLECFLPGLPFMLMIAWISGIIALVIRGFITWLEEIKLKEALKQKNHEMELALVKSQLDPHFLFNTINNIDVLILKSATEASNYLNKLSDIMRFMLFETKTDKIMLEKEVKYIEKYIELQKIRTSNTNYVNFIITGNLNGQKIAPMIFIPFIENAFKHTNNKKLKDAININILIEKETIKLVCENKFDATRQLKQENNGLGNDLIEKRLQLIYPEQHTLKVVNQNNLYSVFLTVDI